MWISLFSSLSTESIESAKNNICLRRYDSASNSYKKECSFYYYDADQPKWDTNTKVQIYKTNGVGLPLEIGKTYVFYEDKSPTGCEKAEKITVTITEDTKEIILKS